MPLRSSDPNKNPWHRCRVDRAHGRHGSPVVCSRDAGRQSSRTTFSGLFSSLPRLIGRNNQFAGQGARNSKDDHRQTAMPPDYIRYAESIAVAEAKLADIDREESAAGALIQSLIENTEFSDTIALTRVKTLLDTILTDDRRYLANETKRLLSLLDTGNTEEIAAGLERVEGLRDELTRKMNAIRSEMLTLVQASTATTLRKQRELMVGAAALTAL